MSSPHEAERLIEDSLPVRASSADLTLETAIRKWQIPMPGRRWARRLLCSSWLPVLTSRGGRP